MINRIILLILCFLPYFSAAGVTPQKGKATYYASSFNGKKTTTGEPYNPKSYTAAHATLPLHSYVRVQNLQNGRSVVVRINDRMSRKSRFIIDVSTVAAKELKIYGKGMGQVRLTRISKQEALALQKKEKKQHEQNNG
ncbi:septal ring lytic transglycosylase RlpA family protein [Rufibacter ruber]|uniref:septal ring lytic transglycosylase RlpA family protein n=1 Tax=Rufibacter ruber TaxID=1783499 RepID=UPI00137B3C4B|nr:septal ring lytic transglycosylase RlpA family protein [Rufibacter ruber]